MNKISTLALIAALGLAAPAFAQTPADIKNGVASAPAAAAAASTPMHSDNKGEKVKKDKMEVKKDKKEVHHAKHKLHHDKKEMKKDEKKKDDTTGK